MTITPVAGTDDVNWIDAGLMRQSSIVVIATGPGGGALQVAGSAASNSASAGIYRRSAAVSATAGDGVIVTGVTTSGTVNLTLQNGGSLVVNVPLGSTILPLGVTAATLGTAVGGSFQSLFFT